MGLFGGKTVAKAAEVRFKETENKLAAISRSQALIEFNLDGTVVSANQNFCDVMGYLASEIEGRHHSLFVDPAEAASKEYRDFWRDLNEGKFAARKFRRLAKGGRDATNVFLQRNIGDVLITFESEVISVDREFGEGKVDAVHPSISIVAENPVAVVERTVAKKGSADLAKAYLDYLYTDEAQEIAAKHALRPRNASLLKKYANVFKPIQLFQVSDYFGTLTEAQKVHFSDGGLFDKIYTVR
jgi:PAS domain S-box-containing protein